MFAAAIAQPIALPFQKWRDFSGRAERKEFWSFFLFCLIGELLLLALDVTLDLYFPAIENGIFSGLFSLVTFVPLVAVITRRLHDVGKSGWLQLIIFVPFIGFVVLLTFWLRASQPRANDYGPPITVAS
jgi:uncharacterized membrane protein YhaH (DUF805 family)